MTDTISSGATGRLTFYVGILTTIAVVASLYLATSVFAPVAGALFIIALAWPIQDWLQQRMPRLLALAIVMCAVVVVFLGFAATVAWGFGRVVRALIAEAPRFQSLYDAATLWLEGRGIVVDGVWTEHFNLRWLIATLQSVTGRVNTTITFWLVVAVYVILGLLEVRTIETKIRALVSSDAARIAIEGTRATAERFRRYMMIRTWMSIATGVTVWALASLSGLALAPEWGVIAFALNYIPFIGPFIATVFPTFYALAQFESWQAALVVFACLNVIQFVIGSYIEPRVSGSALAVSPFIVLLSVFFWTWMWGFFGAFIGVPITIAILTFCAQHPSTQWIAELFGDPDAPPKSASTA
ncbi:AI-2E family transporter [Pseudorhodoplanes sp.]|uniref:AI-2E family transporter n=1 Tax=Pseudorhodoplanes sp. TaxID=1934341 RepID=UPI002D106DE2|nr:AI-2E family transporter [Pseudorhodoplanes sp.]HWV53135.1 AI-2E family transporter [Pseudorhodoplanes sp.]